MHLRRDGDGCSAANSSRAAVARLSLCIDAIGIDVVAACSAIAAVAESAKGSCYALVRHLTLSSLAHLFSLSLSLFGCLFFSLFTALSSAIVAPFPQVYELLLFSFCFEFKLD